MQAVEPGAPGAPGWTVLETIGYTSSRTSLCVMCVCIMFMKYIDIIYLYYVMSRIFDNFIRSFHISLHESKTITNRERQWRCRIEYG